MSGRSTPSMPSVSSAPSRTYILKVGTVSPLGGADHPLSQAASQSAASVPKPRTRPTSIGRSARSSAMELSHRPERWFHPPDMLSLAPASRAALMNAARCSAGVIFAVNHASPSAVTRQASTFAICAPIVLIADDELQRCGPM